MLSTDYLVVAIVPSAKNSVTERAKALVIIFLVNISFFDFDRCTLASCSVWIGFDRIASKSFARNMSESRAMATQRMLFKSYANFFGYDLLFFGQ